MRRTLTGLATVLCLAATVTGCGAASAPQITVSVGDQTLLLLPTQYCLDGTAKIYAGEGSGFTPPVLRVAPRQTIELDAPAEVADSGWQVQIFDEKLDQQLGQVSAGKVRQFEAISTSDAAPAAYFLVIVQNAGTGCEGLSGAWPVGFIREG